jgi:hypothetical protein
VIWLNHAVLTVVFGFKASIGAVFGDQDAVKPSIYAVFGGFSVFLGGFPGRRWQTMGVVFASWAGDPPCKID